MTVFLILPHFPGDEYHPLVSIATPAKAGIAAEELGGNNDYVSNGQFTIK